MVCLHVVFRLLYPYFHERSEEKLDWCCEGRQSGKNDSERLDRAKPDRQVIALSKPTMADKSRP